MRSGSSPELSSTPLLPFSSNGVHFTSVMTMQRIAGGWQINRFGAPIDQSFTLLAQGRASAGYLAASSIIESTARVARTDTMVEHRFG